MCEINYRKRQRISELVRDAAKGRMLAVLDLEPVVAASTAVDALAMLGDQTLKPHPARVRENLSAVLMYKMLI